MHIYINLNSPALTHGYTTRIKKLWREGNGKLEDRRVNGGGGKKKRVKQNSLQPRAMRNNVTLGCVHGDL